MIYFWAKKIGERWTACSYEESTAIACVDDDTLYIPEESKVPESIGESLMRPMTSFIGGIKTFREIE